MGWGGSALDGSLKLSKARFCVPAKVPYAIADEVIEKGLTIGDPFSEYFPD